MKKVNPAQFDMIVGGTLANGDLGRPRYINGPFVVDGPYGNVGGYGGDSAGGGSGGSDYLVNVVSGIYGVAATAGCSDLTAGTAPNICRGVGVVVGATAKQVITEPRDYPVRVTGSMP